MNFGEVIKQLNYQSCLTRLKWNDGVVSDAHFIFKQEPLIIKVRNLYTVPIIPERAKKIFEQRAELVDLGDKPSKLYTDLTYADQIIKVDNENNAAYYIPTTEDMLADDWYAI